MQIPNFVATATSLENVDNVFEFLDPKKPHVDTNRVVLSIIQPELLRFIIYHCADMSFFGFYGGRGGAMLTPNELVQITPLCQIW